MSERVLHVEAAHRPVWWTAIIAVAVMLGVEARGVAFRYFVNDDYQVLYTAWLRSLGKMPPKDFGVQSYHLLPGLFSWLFRVGGDHIETAYWARAVMWMALVLIAVLSVQLSRRVLPLACAPFALVASIASWPMLERALDLRPEAIMAVLWLAALLLALQPARSSARSRIAVGVLFGVALVLRSKSVVLFPFLIWSMASQIERTVFVRRLVLELTWFGVGIAAAAGLFLLYLAASGEWPYFIEGNRQLAHVTAGALDGTAAAEVGLRGDSLALLWRHDRPLVLLALLGVYAVARGPRASMLPVSIIAAFIVTYVAVNPAFYCYNFVLLMPLIAPIVAAGCGWLVSKVREGRPRVWASIVLVLLFPILHGPALVRMLLTPTNGHQVAFAHALSRTSAGTTVFALEELGMFRPSTYDWRLSAVSLPLYASGSIDLHAQLEATLPEVVVLSYRVPGWLKRQDAMWLTQNYVIEADQVALRAVIVSDASPSASLKLARKQPFRVGNGACAVDGVLRQRGERLALLAGEHRVEFSGERCIVYFDWPELASIRSNPVPYLLPPEWSAYEDG